MALTTCKECKKEISSKADSCPHCGYKPFDFNYSFGFFDFLIILFIFAAVDSCIFDDKKKTSTTTPQPAAPVDLKKEAAWACMSFIKQVLNDPGSAEFEHSSKAKVFEQSKNEYKVFYPLRAKNGFNALRKTNYFCHIKLDGQNWNPIEVSEFK